MDQDLPIKPINVLQELIELNSELDKTIIAAKEHIIAWSAEDNPNVYAKVDTMGRPALADLLVARANVLIVIDHYQHNYIFNREED